MKNCNCRIEAPISSISVARNLIKIQSERYKIRFGIYQSVISLELCLRKHFKIGIVSGCDDADKIMYLKWNKKSMFTR